MNEMKHTPGRWSMQHRGDLGEYHVNSESGFPVARCERRNDAALIARAPDLAAENAKLRSVLEHIERVSTKETLAEGVEFRIPEEHHQEIGAMILAVLHGTKEPPK